MNKYVNLIIQRFVLLMMVIASASARSYQQSSTEIDLGSDYDATSVDEASITAFDSTVTSFKSALASDPIGFYEPPNPLADAYRKDGKVGKKTDGIFALINYNTVKLADGALLHSKLKPPVIIPYRHRVLDSFLNTFGYEVEEINGLKNVCEAVDPSSTYSDECADNVKLYNGIVELYAKTSDLDHQMSMSRSEGLGHDRDLFESMENKIIEHDKQRQGLDSDLIDLGARLVKQIFYDKGNDLRYLKMSLLGVDDLLMVENSHLENGHLVFVDIDAYRTPSVEEHCFEGVKKNFAALKEFVQSDSYKSALIYKIKSLSLLFGHDSEIVEEMLESRDNVMEFFNRREFDIDQIEMLQGKYYEALTSPEAGQSGEVLLSYSDHEDPLVFNEDVQYSFFNDSQIELMKTGLTKLAATNNSRSEKPMSAVRAEEGKRVEAVSTGHSLDL